MTRLVAWAAWKGRAAAWKACASAAFIRARLARRSLARAAETYANTTTRRRIP